MAIIITCFAIAVLLLVIRMILKVIINDPETYDRIDKWLFYPMLVCFLVGFITMVICADSILTPPEIDF